MHRACVCVAALFLCFGSMGFMCVPPEGTPEPDVCSAGSFGTIDQLELGHAGDSRFMPLLDDATVLIDFGGQGSAMVGLRLRAQGTDVPDCLAHQLQITSTDGQHSYGASARPVRTYEDDRGRSTATIWIVLEGRPPSGEPASISATIGQMTLTRQVTLGGS